MGKAVMVLCMVLFMGLSPSLSIAQTKPRRRPVPATPPLATPTPVVDDLSTARSATNTFLKGIKIADLPEGREMMREVQWITGELELVYMRTRPSLKTRPFLRSSSTPIYQACKDISVLLK